MGDKLTKLDLARRLNGRRGSATGEWGEASQPSRTRHGTATADAANGRAPILLDGAETAVPLACDVPVKSGDRVTVVSQGGTYKVIAVTTLANMVAEVSYDFSAVRDAVAEAEGQAAAAATAAGNAVDTAGDAFDRAGAAIAAAQAAEQNIQILDASTSHSVATIFSALADNLLADVGETTRYKVRGPADRYWSDANNSARVSCSLVRVADSPLADMDVACMFVADGAQTSAVSRRMAWYDGASLPLREGSSYVLSCWAYADAPTGCSVSLQVGTPGSSWKGQNSKQAMAAGWRRHEWRFTYKAATHGSAPRAYAGATFEAGTAATAFTCGARLVCADEWDEVSTLVRQTAEGLLVASVGSTVGALVSAAGQFTVNELTWAGGDATIGRALASFNGGSSSFMDSNGKVLATFGTTGSVMGRTDGTQRNVYVGPEGVLLREGGTNVASFTSDGTVFYAGGKKRAAYTSAGTVLYGADGTTENAIFGTTSQVGPTNSVHAVIANQSFDVVTGDATPKKLVSMTASGTNSRIESTQRPLLSGFFGKSGNVNGLQSYVNASSKGIGLVAADVNAPVDKALFVKAAASLPDGLVYAGKKIGGIADYGRVDTTQGGTWWWQRLPDGRVLVNAYNPSYTVDLANKWGTSGLWSSGVHSWTPPSQVPGTSWSSVSIGFVGGWGVVSSFSGRMVRWKGMGSNNYAAKGGIWLEGVMLA